MTKILKTVVAFAIMCAASLAGAATYYSSKDSCEVAWREGRAENYQPTGKHKSFGQKRVDGYENRSLEGDACVLLAAQPGKRWVFLKQGTKVYTKGADIKFLAECQNDMFEIAFLKKDEPVPPTVTACKENCNQTVTQVITHVVKEVKVCEAADGSRFPPVNNRCTFEPVKADVSLGVEAKASASCAGGCTATAQALVGQKTPRTDGRCVVAVAFQGGVRHIRLAPEKNTNRLMAMVVDSEEGNLNRNNPITYVGGDNNVLHAHPTCEAAVKGFTSQISFGPTTKRLHLPGCEFKGRV